MKKYILLFCVCLFSIQVVSAQCVGGTRYKAVSFDFDTIMNVTYGANVFAGDSVRKDLLLDIYVPKNDTFQKRPVIFFTHGGSFIFGTKKDGDVVYLCKEFAKRGYVCVSQDYRLGMEAFNSLEASKAVWRATQDARAAIRFMKANATTYKIDTNMIIYGGSSAGGFTALHTAFFDEPQELLPGIDTTEFTGAGSTGLGNFRGTTNNLPNSSDGIKAVVNLCGAIGDTAWIQPKDKNVVVINMHGTADKTVPYGSAIIKLLNFIPLLEVDGSYSIHKALDKKQQENYFYTYCGSDHVPYAGTTPMHLNLMDTTIRFISRHLYEKVLKCGNSEINIRSLVDSSDCVSSGIDYLANDLNELKLYPNPSNVELTIEVNYEGTSNYSIYDVKGDRILNGNFEGRKSTINVQSMPVGMYMVKIQNAEKVLYQKLIINR